MRPLDAELSNGIESQSNPQFQGVTIMKGQSHSRRDAAMFLVALLTLLFIAGDHPLVEHWGDVATSSNEEWGSKWIHTDTGGVRYGLWGESASSEARGVYGNATFTGSSGLAIGVVGRSTHKRGVAYMVTAAMALGQTTG